MRHGLARTVPGLRPQPVSQRGQVVDGTGQPAFTADVAVSDGLIVAVGQLVRREAKRVIDAAGGLLTPRFVDIHTRFDGQVCWDKQVTPYSLDIGAQLPHVALRHYVMGEWCYEDATAADMEQMAAITRQALADGALGFSTSRFYGHIDKAGNVIPGTNATADEMVAIAGIAEAKGIHVREALMDVMANRRPILFLLGKYRGDLQDQIDAIKHEHSVFGLSDGGAHCGVLCDASVPTYMLAYMTRDRTKGATLPLEFVVHKMTQDTAEVYGLPAGGKRIIQRAHGYRMTICHGEVTYENGEHNGAMPGRLVRGER